MRQKSMAPKLIMLGIVVMLIIAGMRIMPQYSVWRRELKGQALLREAEWSKRVAVEEAKAAFESAKHYRNAEVERAHGVAEAMEIIGETLTPLYITYLWTQGLHDGTSEVIYVPTEGQLPILEAGRFGALE